MTETRCNLYAVPKAQDLWEIVILAIWKIRLMVYPNSNRNKVTFLSLSSDLPILVRWDLGVGPLNSG